MFTWKHVQAVILPYVCLCGSLSLASHGRPETWLSALWYCSLLLCLSVHLCVVLNAHLNPETPLAVS